MSYIIWNGGLPLSTGSPHANDPTPSAAGAMKTIKLRNNSQEMIYPFIRGENQGKDPNATPTNAPYEMATLTGPENPDVSLTLFNQINNPGPGEFGALVSAPGYLAC